MVSLIMKPIGGSVHLRHGTVRRDLVLWLCLGSVPAAFAGVLLLKSIGGDDLDSVVRRSLGIALLVAAFAMTVRAVQRRRAAAAGTVARPAELNRPATLAIGVAGGLIVGMTSVGSGSLMIVLMTFLYPGLSAAELVGTDLVQAIPLVGSAAFGHLLFGDVQLGLTASLLIGALPGVYIGARLSSRAPDNIVLPILIAVLTASSLKLLNVI
jgi:uncharacterized membrane protein YfcA